MKYANLKSSLLFIRQKYPFAAVLLLVIFYFLFIWSPVNLWMMHLKNRMISNQQSLVWMQRNSESVMSSRKLPAIFKDKSFLFTMNIELKHLSMGKFVTNLMLINPSVVQITCANIDFDELIQGIEQLTVNKKMSVIKITVYKTGFSNHVNAIIQLQ